MSRYNRGEAVIISLVIKDLDLYNNVGAQVNPSSTPLITITDPNGTVVVNAVSMTFNETGNYYYNYGTTADSVLGRYKVLCQVTDDTLITIQEDFFTVGR